MIKHIITIASLLILFRCANQMAPTGGPADKTAPVLQSSTPSDNQKNYAGQTIEVAFDENIKVNNPKEEIIITPTVGKKTKFVVRGKKLIITPETVFQKNTTYSVSFRDGVQDITESNPASNLRLAFSTGSTIDSSSISGVVTDLFTEKESEKITVALFESDTFNIFKHEPIYFALTDKKGNFTISNIKTRPYFIYAFEDKNKNLKVESQNERFAFLKSSVHPDSTAINVSLKLYKADSRPIRVLSVRNAQGLSSIRFNKSLTEIKVPNKSRAHALQVNQNHTELSILHNLPENDSLPFKIILADSLQQKLDTLIYIKSTNLKYVKEQLKISPNKNEYINPKSTRFEYITNQPLSTINFDSLYIEYDSALHQKIQPKQITYDTLYGTLQFELALNDSAINTKSKIILAKSAFLTSGQDSSKRVEQQIKLIKSEETSTLRIKLETEKTSFIAQLVKDNSVVKSSINSKDIAFSYLEPATYQVRIIIDSNKNGRWDPGNFQTRIEPEAIIYYQNTEKQKNIPTRANWEVGPLVIKF